MVKGGDVEFLGQMAQSLEQAEKKLEEAYKKQDFEEFNRIKKFIVNVQQKLKQSLLKGYPNLCVEFDVQDFLKGAPLDQMNYVVAGVNAGIITPNEAREYLGKPNMDGANELNSSKSGDAIQGTSPQDTGGGGGNQTKKMNIGK